MSPPKVTKGVALKLQLKQWEKAFQKVNGRKPSRDDIKLAGPDVKEMYKNYWQTKCPTKSPVTTPKKSTAGLLFFEDSIMNSIKTPEKMLVDDGDPFASNLMKFYKNKKALQKKKNQKRVTVLEVVPETPEKEEEENMKSRSDDSKENYVTMEQQKQSESLKQVTTSNLFDDDEEEENSRDMEAIQDQVKKDVLMFDGCELLPVDFKKKRNNSRKITSKKKSAENYVRIDLKHKSFAPKGYKKLNIQKHKRKQNYKLKRNKCFTCGEEGHWSKDCPMRLSNKQKTDEDGIPILDADQIVPESDDELVVKAPRVVYSKNQDVVNETISKQLFVTLVNSTDVHNNVSLGNISNDLNANFPDTALPLAPIVLQTEPVTIAPEDVYEFELYNEDELANEIKYTSL